MNNSTSQKKYLEKICESSVFTKSKTYQSYLTFLAESAWDNKELKETTIAFEYFSKDASFNPAEDTIVRSHTYNLRKKLEAYYLDEGREDSWRLKIPKGHYEVKFIPVTNKGFSFHRLKPQSYYLFTIAIFSLLLLIGGMGYLNMAHQLSHYKTIDIDDPVWGDFLQSSKPVLIVLGDHFFFNEYSTQYDDLISIRHAKINSMEDLQELQKKFPKNNLGPTAEPYFPYHSVWSLPGILPLFYSVHQEPIIRKSSSLTPQMLDEYNMIFLGSIKTLYVLKHTLTNSHFDFDISPHKVFFNPPDSGAQQIFETSLHSSGPNDDLVLALKLPGPAQNSIFIIASYHSLGAPEIVKYLAKPNLRQDLENRFKDQYGEIPRYFEVLFRVNGIDKTAYSTDILICNKIDAK